MVEQKATIEQLEHINAMRKTRVTLSASTFELVRLAVLALYVPLWSSVRGGVFKYNQVAVYSSARTAFSFAWPVLSSRMCLVHFSNLIVSSVQLRSSSIQSSYVQLCSLLAQHSRASRCCLAFSAQGTPEHPAL